MMRKQHLLLSVAVLALSASIPIAALGADQTVNGTLTNTQTVANGDDITITESGAISTTGGNGNHSVVIDSNSTVQNDGMLSSTGLNSNGVLVNSGSDNTINNTGTINVTGGGSNGVRSINGNNNIFTNSGTIISNASGFESTGNNNTLTNTATGTITSAGYRGMTVSGDSNIIENAGTLSAALEGIYLNNDSDSNTVTNSGTINSAGTGISFGDDSNQNIVNNTGTIITSGSLQSGIDFGAGSDNNIINNSGTITPGGNGIYLRSSSNNNQVTNSGTITTDDSGFLVYGDSNTLKNTSTGTITNTGAGYGFLVTGDSNTIINDGTVDSAQRAIFVSGSNNNVINSGTLNASTDAVLVSGSNNSVSNSGTVISTSGHSILMNTSTSTLNLSAPAFLGGTIGLLNNAPTVNITSGKSHSFMWRIEGNSGATVNLSGPVPIFYNPDFFGAGDGLVATYDPSHFAASFNSLADLSGNVSGLVRSRLPFGSAPAEEASSAALGYASEASASDAYDEAFAALDEASAKANGLWVSGFGSVSSYDGQGASLDQDITQGGAAVGYDAALGDGWSLGALIGYSWANMEAQSTTTTALDNDVDGVFGSVYGQKRIGVAFVEAALSAGFQSHDNERFVNDSSMAGGNAMAKASYDSWWIAPELRLGADLVGASGVIYTPSAQVRYAYQSTDSYTETGTATALASVGDSSMGLLETRMELAATKRVENLSFTGRLGWQYRASVGEDDVAVTLIGQSLNVGYEANEGHAAFIGFDASAQMTQSLSLNLSAEATRGEGRFGASGLLNLTAHF